MPNYDLKDYPYTSREEALASLQKLSRVGSPSARTDVSLLIFAKYPDLNQPTRNRRRS